MPVYKPLVIHLCNQRRKIECAQLVVSRIIDGHEHSDWIKLTGHSKKKLTKFFQTLKDIDNSIFIPKIRTGFVWYTGGRSWSEFNVDTNLWEIFSMPFPPPDLKKIANTSEHCDASDFL
jgi:hypothetical protein